jgi:hypothetical protein
VKIRDFTEEELVAALGAFSKGSAAGMDADEVSAIMSSAVAILHRKEFRASDDTYQKAAREQKGITEMVEASLDAGRLAALQAIVSRHEAAVKRAVSAR